MNVMITPLLDQLEQALKVNNLWSIESPSTEALASQAPFCFDTMRFEQWLQYVFIFKIRLLISQQSPLPKGAQITPMAEQMLGQYSEVVSIIRKIDKELS